MRNIGLMACLALCFYSLGAEAGAKAEKSREALNQIHERIESLKKELSSSQEAHADATDALKESEKSISDTNRKLFELSQQEKQNQSMLNDLQDQKAGLETTLQEQQKLLGAQVYQQYLHGQQSYLQIVLQQQSPSAIARQLHYFSYVSKARAELIKSMQRNLGKVTRLNQETENALKEVAQLKSEQEKQRKELQLQKAERSKVLQKLSAQISAQRGEINKLKRDERSLSQLVERLAKLAASKPPAKKRTESTNNKPEEPAASKNQEPVGKNDALPTNAFDGSNFAALRGKLNLPVRGEIVNRFGAAREDSGVSWKGLFIRASEGNEVKSVASGRVVFADWMRGFGNLLIIDHGDGYMSLYGNNQSLLRKVGDIVKGGDTVAAVGNSGGNETSGLYYELRKLSKPFDPLSWSILK